MAAVGSQLKKSSVGGSGRSKEGEMPDEEQLELSMKQLNLLHIKCRELRTTIQRMLEAIPNNSTAEEVYECFVKSVVAASTQIKDFNALYNSEESKRVLDQAKKSRDANPKGIKPWRAKDHPDWLDLAQ
ncbi:hypothetical protein F4815DRAFT_476586 [Daldinia loculata]|uniref:uncharacterized protein n=1 Tax=Daldinia loculata TaxID=103429 RepID=UPI0020C437B7|nr:uncharacterized protein F4817DRAFT_352765 [Daldinia loculata]KAI1642490.1 hypothetical protein F4817DRAFT_352765 [Daldinia loculata]KAI2778774.1 hypothetical protein F4815DRAFT_476586 [Daldinia loculata]